MLNNKNIFSLDCETNGLYGDCFAVGVIILSPEGLIIDKFSGISQVEEVTNDWVKENVLPELSGLKIFSTRKQMRDAFWEFWIKHKESCICISDIGAPVESGFFKQCVLDDLDNRQWNAPYPLHEVATLLFAKGIDPDINRIEYSGINTETIKQHNPVDDAYVSGLCWIKALEVK